ncbi:MAG: Ig-like domain-containing protein [Chloroflexota bacterium]
MKVFLVCCVALLGVTILWVGSGAVGPFISSMVKGFGQFVGNVGTVVGSTAPSATAQVSDAPTIAPLDQAFTNDETLDLTVTVPAAITGHEGYTLRLYNAVAGADAAVVAEVPVGPLSIMVIPNVTIEQGRNDLQASIVGSAGESERSPVVTVTLDTSKPKVSVISPKDGAQVSKATITIKGKSQALSDIRVENAANKAIANTKADKTGLWTTTIDVTDGANTLTVIATDPAGNQNSATLTVQKGSGKLTVLITGSAYRFKVAKLPKTVTFTARVTGPDGKPLGGATALFTVSVPGLQAIVSGEIRTGADGVATFTTTIPSGAMAGPGLATVLVTTDTAGTATDRAVLTVE